MRFDLAPSPRTSGALLWTAQLLLAALFLFAGGMKLVAPAEALEQQSTLPVLFLRFIGLAELLGALGLVLPWLLRIRPWLTPLAAAGLVIIMIGATVLTAAQVSAGAAAMPLVVGLLATYIARGRARTAPTPRPAH